MPAMVEIDPGTHVGVGDGVMDAVGVFDLVIVGVMLTPATIDTIQATAMVRIRAMDMMLQEGGGGGRGGRVVKGAIGSHDTLCARSGAALADNAL